MVDLEKKRIEEKKQLKRMMEEQMRSQREEAQAAIFAARHRSTAEKERHLRQQRELQARIDAAKQKQEKQERTIDNLRQRLGRM